MGYEKVLFQWLTFTGIGAGGLRSNQSKDGGIVWPSARTNEGWRGMGRKQWLSSINSRSRKQNRLLRLISTDAFLATHVNTRKFQSRK